MSTPLSTSIRIEPIPFDEEAIQFLAQIKEDIAHIYDLTGIQFGAPPTRLTAANAIPRCNADVTPTRTWKYSKVHPLDKYEGL